MQLSLCKQQLNSVGRRDVDGYGLPETMDDELVEEPQSVVRQDPSNGEYLQEMLSPSDNDDGDDDDEPLEIDRVAESNRNHLMVVLGMWPERCDADVAIGVVADDLVEEDDWREFEEAREPNPYAIEDVKEQEEEDEEDWGNFAEAPTERQTRINVWTLDEHQFLEETQQVSTISPSSVPALSSHH